MPDRKREPAKRKSSTKRTVARPAIDAVHARWLKPIGSYADVDRPRILRSVSGRLYPDVHLLAHRWAESRLAATEPARFDAAAWLLALQRPWDAQATIETLWREHPPRTLEDRLHVGYLLSVVAAAEELTDRQVYGDLWASKELTQDHPSWFETGLALAASDPGMRHSLHFNTELLERLRPALDRAAPLAAAVFELVSASHANHCEQWERSARSNAGAYARFTALRDRSGLAQCALVEYRREIGTRNRSQALLAYLEYAVARYEMDCRYADAAELIACGVVPLLKDVPRSTDEPIKAALLRAASLAERGRSLRAQDCLCRAALGAGFFAIVADGLRFQRIKPAS